MNDTIEFFEKVYQKNEEIVFRKIADEAILVPIRGNLADMQRLFMLTPVAEFIWQQLKGDVTLEAVLMKVLDNFEVSREQAEKDICEFVLELNKFGLIGEEPGEVTTGKQPL